MCIKSGSKKMRQAQKLAINKKSTFFVLSSWNLVKIINSWGNHFHKVSWEYNKNCGFFTNDQCFNMSRFFWLRLYIFVHVAQWTKLSLLVCFHCFDLHFCVSGDWLRAPLLYHVTTSQQTKQNLSKKSKPIDRIFARWKRTVGRFNIQFKLMEDLANGL